MFLKVHLLAIVGIGVKEIVSIYLILTRAAGSNSDSYDTR